MPLGTHGLKAEFYIGLGVSSPDFLTNKEIRGEISKAEFPNGKRLGYMDANFEPTRHTIICGSYYPFFAVSGHFSKKGIAQLLERSLNNPFFCVKFFF